MGRITTAHGAVIDTQRKYKRGRGMKVETTTFGQTSDGQKVQRFECQNDRQLKLILTDYGAHVVALETPDRQGTVQNVNLGLDQLDGYLGPHPSLGSTVGRFCNRIAKGQFTLDGTRYTLATNNGPNHLHGGMRGFNKYVWNAEVISDAERVGVAFRRLSPAGEEGYPGSLDVTARYWLTNENALTIEFEAETDAATVVNLTNHCYWNLAGVAGGGHILDHELTLAADHYLEVDETLIPTGNRLPVDGTPFDFRNTARVGEHIAATGGDPIGYDHCFVLAPSRAGQLQFAARVREPKSGRVMEVWTTQPGIQFYTGNFLSGQASAGGYAQHAGLCLETQHFPDSPNHADFPTVVLRPGDRFHQVTQHRFAAEPL